MSENENPTNNEETNSEEDSRSGRDRGDRGDRRGGSRGGRSAGGGGGGGRGRRRRGTYYCPKGKCFDYKNLDTLTRYVNESGKIKPRRQTGNCSRCQRELAREIKRARHLALLSFADSY